KQIRAIGVNVNQITHMLHASRDYTNRDYYQHLKTQVDVLQGIYLCIKQLENGEAKCENQYARSVRREGNQQAKELIKEVFEIVPRRWRGIGEIPKSGLGLREGYAEFDALQRFEFVALKELNFPAILSEETECISGEIMQGIKKPSQCEAFGTRCTPEHPLGAPMVSSEGACAAYYRYRINN
ncbi:MAG: hydrogenase formation protein HypD, partial [Okeania sp. SIO2H7]|nr:hydrogenase formation protein HypD [Okeania sp. SIO2H7]